SAARAIPAFASPAARGTTRAVPRPTTTRAHRCAEAVATLVAAAARPLAPATATAPRPRAALVESVSSTWSAEARRVLLVARSDAAPDRFAKAKSLSVSTHGHVRPQSPTGTTPGNPSWRRESGSGSGS